VSSEVAGTGGEKHGVGDGVGEFGVGLAGGDDFEGCGSGLDSDGAVGFGVGKDLVVFTGARGAAHEVEGFVEGRGSLHDFADELGHGFAVPGAFAAAAHFAEAKLLIIHGGDAPGEGGIATIDSGVALVGAGNDHGGVFLEADAAEVVEDAAVVEFAALGGLAEKGEAAAVEEFGEEVSEADFFGFDAGGGGKGIHFGEVPRIDEGGAAADGFLKGICFRGSALEKRAWVRGRWGG
jgi:hypothetical protein